MSKMDIDDLIYDWKGIKFKKSLIFWDLLNGDVRPE